MMAVLRHELRQARNSLIIWAASIGFLMVICILLFPEMRLLVLLPEVEASRFIVRTV